MAIVVVSDTSPVRALAHLGCLNWLQLLFDEVVVPPLVADELANPPNPLHAVVVSHVAFLRIVAPSDSGRVAALRESLDQGEAEALALAEQLRADFILIDELAGRQIAAEAGFRVQGTLGVILQAKRRGWCLQVEPLINALQNELRFFISPELRLAILSQADELPPANS
jgi:predicted nucleic acid-binding protein